MKIFDRWIKRNTNKTKITKEALLPPNVPGLMLIQSTDKMISQHVGRITEINELAGLSSVNFDRFYLSAIKNYARFVQLLPASEVHHHAEPGGMLRHALEVCVIALKLRRSYLLSDSGEAEEISKNQDLWTYAIFIAALCHDVGKVAVDQRITIYDDQQRQHKWEPWAKFMDQQGRWYTSEFVLDRKYRLHEKTAPLLINRIISSQGMKWIDSDLFILSKWVACLSGDMDNASSIGEIVSLADGKSVASNLGAGNSRMPGVKTKPLHEKMLTALRYLLTESELPLNRNGADGWVVGDHCWLMSKRTVDAIRDQLTQEGHSGVPSKNGRVFDVLQEHGVIIPFGDKAIWPCTIQGNGWQNNLTLIKVEVKKIWTNPEKRPSEFDGDITVDEIKASEDAVNKAENSDKSTTHEKALEKNTILQEGSHDGLVLESVSTMVDIRSKIVNKTEDNLQKVPYQMLEPLNQEVSMSEEEDILAFLPSESLDIDNEISEPIIDIEKEPFDVEKKITQTAVVQHNDQEKKINLTAVTGNIAPIEDSVSLFFSWLQEGIHSGQLKTNQAKARVHRVEEGVIIITPGIFQDFAKTLQGESVKWTSVQQKVLKKNWHVRDNKGLNVVKYQVKGQSKKTTVNAILFKDASQIFGQHALPACNPHLLKMD